MLRHRVSVLSLCVPLCLYLCLSLLRHICLSTFRIGGAEGGSCPPSIPCPYPVPIPPLWSRLRKEDEMRHRSTKVQVLLCVLFVSCLYLLPVCLSVSLSLSVHWSLSLFSPLPFFLRDERRPHGTKSRESGACRGVCLQVVSIRLI